MKKSIILTLVIFLLLSVSTINAQSKVSIYVNDVKLEANGIIKDGSTLVPLRAIFEAMGAEVDWNSETETIISTNDDNTIELTIGKRTAIKNGQDVELATPAQIINGSTMVPVRFVGEAFGAKVDWNGSNNTVKIYTKNYIIPGSKTHSAEEIAQMVADGLKNEGDFTVEISTSGSIDSLENDENVVTGFTSIGYKDGIYYPMGIYAKKITEDYILIVYKDDDEESNGYWLDVIEDGKNVLSISFYDKEIRRFGIGIAYFVDENVDINSNNRLDRHAFELSKILLNQLGVPVTEEYVEDLYKAFDMYPYTDNKLTPDIVKRYGAYDIHIRPGSGAAGNSRFGGVTLGVYLAEDE